MTTPADEKKPAKKPANDAVGGWAPNARKRRARWPSPSEVKASSSPGTPSAAFMPAGEEERRVLRQRAEELARPEAKAEAEDSEQLLCFRLGPSERYGIPYRFLEEILFVRGLTSVPCTPPFIAGVVHRQDELLTVLEPKHFVRTGGAKSNGEARIIVTRSGNLTVGILVDAVEGNLDYRPSGLAAPIRSEGVTNLDYIRGIWNGTIVVLDLESLLSDADLTVGRARRPASCLT